MGKCISKPVPLDDVSAPEKRKSIDDEVPLRKSDRALLLLFNKEEDDTNGHLKGIPEEESPPEEQEEQYPHQDLAQNAEKPTAAVGSTLETIVESKSPDEDQAEGQEEGAKPEDPIEVGKNELTSEKPDVGTDDNKHSTGTQCEIVKVEYGDAVQEAKESEAAAIDKEERPSTPEISESKALLQEADIQLLQDSDTQLKESDAGTFEVELNAQDMELTANVDDAENRNNAKVIDLIKEDSEKFELIFKQISDKFEIAGIPDPYLGALEQEAEQLVAETKAEDSRTSDEPASVEPASEIQEKTEEHEAVVEPEPDICAADLQHSVQDDKEASCDMEFKDEPEQQPESILDSSTSDEPRKIFEKTDGTSEAVVIGESQHDEAPVEEIDKTSEIQEKTDELEGVVEPDSATDLQHPVQDEVPVEEPDNKDASCNMELKDEPEQQPEPMVVATAEDSNTIDEPSEILEKTDGASVEAEAVVIGELQHDEAPVEEMDKASEIQEKTEEHEAVVEPALDISATDSQHPVKDEVPVEENDNKDASCNMELKDEPEQRPEPMVVTAAEGSSTSDEPRENFEKTEELVSGGLQHKEAPVEEVDKGEIQEKTEEHEALVEPESGISATALQHPVQDEVPVEENDNKDASSNMELKDEPEQQPEPMVVGIAAAQDVVESTKAAVEKPTREEAAESVEQHEHEDESAHQNVSDEDHRSETTPEDGKASIEDTSAAQEEAEVQHAESQGTESSSECNALEEPAAANGDHKLEDEKVSKEVSEPNAIEELAQAEKRLLTGEENETLHTEPGAADGDVLEQHAETHTIQESSQLEEPAVAETNEDKKPDLEDESRVEPQNMTSSSTDADGKSLENLSQTEQKEDDTGKTDSAQGIQHVGNEGADSAREQDVDNVITHPAGLSASEGDKRELHGEVPPTNKTADIEPEDLVSETGFPKDIISNEAEEPTNLADKENVENAEEDHPQERETLKHAVIDEPDSAHEKNIEDASVVKELQEVPSAQPFAAPEHDQEQASY